MFTRRRTLIGGGVLTALAVAAVAAVVVWYTQFRGDAPPEVSLSGAVATLNSSPSAADGAPSAGSDNLVGTWVLVPGGPSFVGYRVDEELARIGATTAVGRTGNVGATLTFDGSAITAVQVTADLTTLKSDQSMRDNALRDQALETAKYPTATFVLAGPIWLDSVPAEGVPVRVTAVGDLTLHGVTRRVSVDLQGQRTNGYVVVVGALDIRFADYTIAQPRSFAVLSVADHGTIELQLVFQKDAQA
jgi:polyisoprenoid-binding protein YceI